MVTIVSIKTLINLQPINKNGLTNIKLCATMRMWKPEDGCLDDYDFNLEVYSLLQEKEPSGPEMVLFLIYRICIALTK